MQHVTIDWIIKNKVNLLKFSDLSEQDIKHFWMGDNDKDIIDLKKLIYRYDAPIYQKMIWRFRNCNKSPSSFWNQIDPVQQNNLAFRYDIYFDNKELLYFLSWIKNGLCYTDIHNLDMTDNLYNVWQLNEIKFFFMLNNALQEDFIKRYNTECIDTFNNYNNNNI